MGAIATALAGTSISAFLQGAQNRKNRQFAKEMYDKSRADALADRDFENFYNSPAEQMKRLKDAGLSPWLAFGNGTTATSVSTRGANPSVPEGKAPNVDAISSYYQQQMAEQSIENMKAQNQVLQEDAKLKAAQRESIPVKNENTQAATNLLNFKKILGEQLSSTQIDAAKQQLKKLTADTQYTLDQNERAAAANSKSLEEATERILTMQAQRAKTDDERAEIQARIDNLKKDGTLKQMDINLRKMGISPSDPIYYRVLGQLVNGSAVKNVVTKVQGTVGNMVEELKQRLKK